MCIRDSHMSETLIINKPQINIHLHLNPLNA
jgi:hypothetical protein